MSFIFEWFPSFLFQLCLMLGIGGSIVSIFIDQVSLIPISFRIPFKLISALLLGIGLMFIGYSESNQKWVEKQHAAELKIAKLEIEAGEITVEETTNYVETVKVVKEKGAQIVKEVPIYITKKSDDMCNLTAGVLRAHDSAATQVSRTTSTPNEGTTTIKDGR